MHLAVHVGFGDMVEIDQCQGTDTAARKRLRSPGSDAAQSDDTDRRMTQRRDARLAIEARQAAEPALRIVGRSSSRHLEGTPWARNHRIDDLRGGRRGR